MDLEVQGRIKEIAEKYGPENVVVILGNSDPDGASIFAETVSNGDPSFAGPLAGVALGLPVYHIIEPEIKQEIDPQVYEEQVGIVEMVLDVDAIINAVKSIREQYSKF